MSDEGHDWPSGPGEREHRAGAASRTSRPAPEEDLAAGFLGQSPAFRQVTANLRRLACTELTILLLGETGTGKGLAARAIHQWSPHAPGPLVPINCGALPEALVESELFGHEKGAFTGAINRKSGLVEQAQGGTLFLDEIGDLSPAAQSKLLHLLEERTFLRVGGTQPLRSQARVITATHRDLPAMVAQGTFREDLFYRLGAQVRLPALRQRRQDIPLLARHFIHEQAAQMRRQPPELTLEAEALLQAQEWPGNVRQLKQTLDLAVVMCPGSALRAEDLGPEVVRYPDPPVSQGDDGPAARPATLHEVERRHIQLVLERTGWRIKGPAGAAVLLGLSPASLHFRLKKLGIRRPPAPVS